MKRILSCFSLALCVILGTAFLTACGSSTKWIRPDFTFDNEGISIEFVTNTEKDFDFPIEGHKFEHSKYADENILEYCWVIYNSDSELVGWIEAGNGYDINNDGSYKYGYSSSYYNDVYGYYGTDFCVILKTTDLKIFDNLKIVSDYGSVEIMTGEGFVNPFSATQRYSVYDENDGTANFAAGSEKFVCCYYNVILESIDAPGIETINFTLSLKDE